MKKKINSLTQQEIEKRMEIIYNTNLENIPSSILPEVFSLNYYFISYSHKDYKEVYFDIFNMQAFGMNIWYDRGIPAGRDWKEIAQRNITPFECKGVIIYISENSLISEAVIEEIEYVQSVGKSFIAITIPFTSDYLYQDQSVKGKNYSILEMIKILKENKVITPSKAKKLSSYFPKEVIFLPYDTPIDTKVEKIKMSTPSIPLLNGKIEDGYDENEYFLNITSVNEKNINKVTKQDLYDLINYLGGSTRNRYQIVIEKTCFANCLFLESFYLPDNAHIELFEVGEYAFANDSRFKGFVDSKNQFVDVNPNVLTGGFYNCSSLRNKITCEYDNVGDYAFYNCSSLPDTIQFGEVLEGIGKYAFYGCCSIKKVIMPNNIKKIGENAFYKCSSLKDVTIPDTIKEINKSTFAYCSSLKNIKIPDSVTSIGASAFRNCSSLENIILSNNLVYIGYKSFRGCSSLKYNVYENINYLGSKENPYIIAISLYERFRKVTSLHPSCKILYQDIFRNCGRIIGTFIIPEGATCIGENAFERADSLKEIIIPNSIKYIGGRAFYGCKNLEKVSLPKNIEYFGEDVFSMCPSLKNINYIDS